jgi:hypothetical protein
MIIFGCVGGLLPDIIRIIKNHPSPSLPDYIKSASFWIGLFMLVILGALAAWILEASSVKQALAYGFAAPELISRILADQAGNALALASGPGGFGLRKWWAS